MDVLKLLVSHFARCSLLCCAWTEVLKQKGEA